jgi:hypothetical protein
LPKQQLDISLFTYLSLWTVLKTMKWHSATYIICPYVRVTLAALLQSLLAVVMYKCRRRQQWEVYCSAKCSAAFPKKSPLDCSCVFFVLLFYKYTVNLETSAEIRAPTTTCTAITLAATYMLWMRLCTTPPSTQPMLQHQESDYQQPVSSPVHLYMVYGQWRHEGLYMVPAFVTQCTAVKLRILLN